MHKIFTITALFLGISTTATTVDAYVSHGQDLHFVTDTKVPNSKGVGTVALCHLFNYASLFFVPVYTSLDGYVLSNDECAGSSYSELSAENFAAMQSAGVIPADIPAVPRADLKSMVAGHALLILVAAAIVFKLLGKLMTRVRDLRRGKTPDALAVHSLVAMSQVATADGKIDAAEIQHIAQILTRLTGHGYDSEQVSDLLTRLNPSSADMEQVGHDLSEKDRQIVLEAAINIAVADGEIHPNEYAVVSDLAQHMTIGAEQFRSAIARISIHLKMVHPV